MLFGDVSQFFASSFGISEVAVLAAGPRGVSEVVSAMKVGIANIVYGHGMGFVVGGCKYSDLLGSANRFPVWIVFLFFRLQLSALDVLSAFAVFRKCNHPAVTPSSCTPFVLFHYIGEYPLIRKIVVSFAGSKKSLNSKSNSLLLPATRNKTKPFGSYAAKK